jgi:hypothetical protein
VGQKVFLGSANLLRHEYLGDPTYGHITMESIVERMKTFHVVGAAIYYPFFATCVVAVIRRDPRYLLGWAAAVPWFLLNFAAVQEAKVNFDAYTVFPFIVSLFWVYLYGAALAPPARRMRRGLLELLFAGVCVTSTYAEVRDSVVRFKYLLKVMAMPGRLHRDTLHRFVTVLGEHRSDFRRLYVDPTIAAIALESVSASDAWYPGVGPIDSLAYHGFTVLRRDELVADIIANQLDVCTFMVPTQLRVCSRQPLPSETFAGLTTETVPSIFAFTTFKPPGTLVEPQRITVRPGVVVKGKLGLLPKGTYELTLDVDVALSTTDRSTDRAALEVASERTQLAFAVLDAGPHEIVLPFEADGAIARSFAITAGAATLTIRGAKVRPRSAAP